MWFCLKNLIVKWKASLPIRLHQRIKNRFKPRGVVFARDAVLITKTLGIGKSSSIEISLFKRIGITSIKNWCI